MVTDVDAWVPLLSWARKLMTMVLPRLATVGVKANVPLAGLPLTGTNVEPPGRPRADRATTSPASLSVARTVKLTGAPGATVNTCPLAGVGGYTNTGAAEAWPTIWMRWSTTMLVPVDPSVILITALKNWPMLRPTVLNVTKPVLELTAMPGALTKTTPPRSALVATL